MALVEAFVRNPVKVSVGVLLLALFGSIALFRLPMQLTPEVETPTITIETRWPGASPGEVEREIVQEQEEQLKSVEGLTKLSSESMDSRGRITLEFTVATNMESALLKVNARLQQVREYPEDADEPVITTSNSSNSPIAWFILRPRVPTTGEIEAFQKAHPDLAKSLEPARRAATGGLRQARLKRLARRNPAVAALLPPALDVSKLRRFAEDNIEAAFERVSGVANSNVIGGREDELRVVVDARRLASRHVTLDDLRRALRLRNDDRSGGDFWEGKRRYVVRTLGRMTTPEEVADAVIARRDGRAVYVRDVAEVELGFKKPDGLVRNFGTTAIAVNVIREVGANVIDVMDGLREAMADLNTSVLATNGLELVQVYDETTYIDSAVGLVRRNILLGGILTVLVLLLFLKSARSTIVLALAIPTSIIGTFLVLALMGRSLNVVSLAGLAFAVGMLVDNAVVVLENIYRHYQRGEDRWMAAVKGTQEVWGAVVASTLTTLAVFVPVLFIQEEAGQLFRDIAIAIGAAVGFSMLVSVIVIPTATARILSDSHHGTSEGKVAAWQRGLGAPLAILDRAGAAFIRQVVGVNRFIHRSVLRELALVVVLTGAALATSWALMPKVEYLPTGNRNLVFGILLPPPGYNLDKLAAMGEDIEEKMRPYWDVDAGDPAAATLKFPLIRDFFYVARGRSIFMGVRTADPLRSGELIPLIQGIAASVPGTFAVVKQSSIFESGLSAGRTIDVEISGPDLPELVALGGEVFGRIRVLLPTAQVFPKPSLDLANPEVHVEPDWDKLADVGMDATELGFAVDALVDGAYAADYYIGGDKIDLSIVGAERLASRTQDLEQLPLATRSGVLVPLGSVARINLSSGPEQINHRERQRTITIQVSPPPDVALEDAMESIDTKVLAPMREASRGRARFVLSGTADKLRSTWKALRFNVFLALMITYLLMAALFESWLNPFVIILSVPLGAAGGIAALALLNLFVPQPLDVLTMLGFVILIGTVVNNAILIVHQTLNHIGAEGMAVEEALLASIRDRIRPIFMTTVTTVSGLIPLVIFPGAGAELYRGLGAVVLGGLVVSTLFTLLLVPTLFHLVHRMIPVRARGQRTPLPAPPPRRTQERRL
ncbi:MAG TPA: efflux RND transporter permease subunit [Planctomycetes bacterium]|nr:efflux RND transporter permease subunit [Planctomycetota bacterium]